MITIGALIGSKISKVVATLGVTLCLFGGTILFYEGVPFLNWWPANKIPVYGWLVEGEINRRAKPMIEAAVLEERALWELEMQKALDEYNQVVEEKNDTIRTITEEGLRAEEVLRQQHSEIVNMLNKSIDLSNQETSDEDLTSNPLRMRIPSSVYDNIR